jgi:hypothetical protein
MNGEPREAPLSTSEHPSPPSNTPPMHEADELPPQAIDAHGVRETTVTKEGAKLAPLFTEEAALAFRSRWDMVQRSFVDDPKEAVHAADELVAQVTDALAQSFANQRSGLETDLHQAGTRTTENLRIALRQYRSYFERLLSI